MRPLGEPTSISNPPSTHNSPMSSTDNLSLADRRMGNGTSSSNANGASNTSSQLVLARRNVSTLTAVQTAAAGAATSLQSRDQLTDIIVADTWVSLFSVTAQVNGCTAQCCGVWVGGGGRGGGACWI
jgi:hypothetical protein